MPDSNANIRKPNSPGVSASSGYNYDHQVTPRVKRLQNLSGLVFILLFASHFVFQILILCDVFSVRDSWYYYIVLGFSILGFSLLYRLASDLASDIFTMSLICLEIFFIVCRPFLLALPPDDKEVFSIIYIFSALFSFSALYLWSVFINNSGYSSAKCIALMLLPMPFLLYTFGYLGALELLNGMTSLCTLMLSNKLIIPMAHMLVCVVMPYGYWRLCHSRHFSGKLAYHELPITPITTLSPFNPYFAIYIIIVAIMGAPFSFAG